MWFRSAFDFLKLDWRGRGRRPRHQRASSRLLLEVLEDRTLPSFLTPVTYAPGVEPMALATADLRNDGIQDLVTIGGYNTVSVLLGNGDGTFQQARTFATGPNPRYLAVGDFTGNGKLDIVTANPVSGSYSGTLSLLLGNGDGTFQAPSTFTLPESPLAIAAGDMNHDGRDDLVVMGAYSNPSYHLVVSVLLGQANGSFATGSTSVITTFSSDSMVLGDFTGDGDLDVAMLSRSSSGSGVSVMLGNGTGALAAPITTLTATAIDDRSSLAVGDVNGDGKLDLVAADYNGENLHVLLGNGDGTFKAPINIPLPTWSGLPQTATDLVMGDLNGDGKMDLAVTATYSYAMYYPPSTDPYYPGFTLAVPRGTVNVLLGNGDGTFTDAQTIPLNDGNNSAPSGIVAANFNGDSFPDLAVTDAGSETVSVLLNGADWSTTPQPSSFAVSGFSSPTTAGASGSFTVTALNADGTTDTGFAGTVHFTSSDGQAALPTDYTFTAADAGVHTFSATLKTAGTQSVTATDGSVTGSETGITVTPAAASKMIVAQQPSTTTAGQTVSPAVTVNVEDQYGNVVTTDNSTASVTLSSGTFATGSATVSAAVSAGVASFSTLKIDTAGTYTLKAADGSLTSAVSGSFTITPAAASKFILTAPASVRAGASFSLTLTVEDAYGNIVPNYTGTVHFSSSDTKATLPANYTFQTTDKGVHTFTGLVLHTKGYQKIKIADTQNSSLTISVTVDVL